MNHRPNTHGSKLRAALLEETKELRPAVPRWAIRTLQRLLRHEPITSIGRVGYLAVAEAAARDLARLPHVDGVYRTGSMRRPSALAPGYSDIDLYLLANLASVENERELREAIGRWHERWTRLLPVFKHIDYGDVAELDRLRRGGGAWAFDIDHRFRCLAGRDRLEPTAPAGRVEEHKLLEGAEVLRRWTKATPNLLDDELGRDPFQDERGSRRLLADVLAAWLGMDRLDPIEVLLARAADAKPPDSVLELARRGPNEGGRDVVIARVAAAGDVLDRLVEERVWEASKQLLPFVEEPNPRLASFADATRAAGFDALVVLEGFRFGGATRTFVVGAARESTGSVVRHLVRTKLRDPNRTLPVPVSHTLLSAMTMLDPFPFAGASLRGVASSRSGAIAGSIPLVLEVPLVGDARRIALARLAAVPRRARGRALRLSARDEAAREATHREIAIGEALATALERGDPRGAQLIADRSPEDWIEALHTLEKRIDRLVGG